MRGMDVAMQGLFAGGRSGVGHDGDERRACTDHSLERLTGEQHLPRAGTLHSRLDYENNIAATLWPTESICIPAYAGIRPQGHTETYALTWCHLSKAFGSHPQGTDGGAFIEFRQAPTGNDNGVPKYHMMPAQDNQAADSEDENVWNAYTICGSTIGATDVTMCCTCWRRPRPIATI